MNSSFLRLAAQVVRGVGRGLQQPQHAAGHFNEQPAPQIERLGGDLVALVEAAKHKAGGRQSCSHSRRAVADDALAVVGLIAVGHQRERLAVMGRVRERGDDRVPDEVVGEARMPQRAGVTEPAHLHRGRPQGEDRQTIVYRVTRQIHENINTVIENLLRGIVVRQEGDIAKSIEGCAQALTHWVMIIRPA